VNQRHFVSFTKKKSVPSKCDWTGQQNSVLSPNPRHIKVAHRRRRKVASRVWLAGQYYDAETGMVNNGFRDCYEPSTGRYCQPDPSGLNGGLGLYVYGLDNPLRYMDPSGLFPEPPVEEPLEADGVTPANEGMRELQQAEAAKKEAEQANQYEQEGPGEAFASSEFAPGGECKAKGAESSAEVGPLGFRGSKGYQLSSPAYQPRRNQPGSVGGVDYSGHALDQTTSPRFE
jgi:RHS repeat-associated protein